MPQTIHPIQQKEVNNSLCNIVSPEKMMDDSVSFSRHCRICLSEENQQGQSFIRPCRCSGSLKYVHKKCCQKWAEHLYGMLETEEEKINMQDEGFQCQVCKFKIKVLFDFQRHLVTKDQLGKICSESVDLTIVIILFFLIALGAFSFFVYQADNDKKQFDGSQPARAFFSILAILIIVVFFGAGLFFFISRYIWIQSFKVTEVKEFQHVLRELALSKKGSNCTKHSSYF